MLLIHGGCVIDPKSGNERYADILVGDDGIIKEISENITGNRGVSLENSNTEVIDATGFIVTAGFIDAHVHFRDPGQTHKEDIETGANAAKRGGYTSVIMMGNTVPPMDNEDTIKYVLDKGMRTGINVYTCANVTKGMQGMELTDMEKLKKCGAVLFSDDGKPICDESVMLYACKKAAELDMVISLHEENPKFIKENGVNKGYVAEKLGLVGSGREAEISMVKRDIELSRETGCKIVVQHISTKEATALIREAKKEGVKISAEATPHHYSLTEEAVLKHGTLAKMNPPLRLESDRMAIIEGLKDGTIDMIATDHAPHSIKEKNAPFKDAPSGIIGLETALPLGITNLVNTGYLDMVTFLRRMSYGTAKLYGIRGGCVDVGAPADLVIFDKNEKYTIDNNFASKAKNSPFVGVEVSGKVKMTIANGNIVYKD